MTKFKKQTLFRANFKKKKKKKSMGLFFIIEKFQIINIGEAVKNLSVLSKATLKPGSFP